MFEEKWLSIFRKEVFMKKVLKSLVAVMLALVLTFTFAADTANAATVASKLRTNAKVGKTYTVKTYFPGVGYQKVNVKFATVNKTVDQSYGVNINMADVVVNYSIPASTRNVLKRNTVKVVRAGNGRFSIGSPLAIDATSGKILSMSTTNNQASQKVATSNQKNKVYKQTQGYYHATLTLPIKYTETFHIEYFDSYAGNILVGYAGVKKKTSSYDSNISSFAYGNKSITGTNYFKKKKKDLSIWLKL